MKKLILALGVVLALGLTSCKSVDEKLDDLEKEAKEFAELRDSGDAVEAAKKSGELVKAANKLQGEKLNEEQTQRLADIMAEMNGLEGAGSFGGSSLGGGSSDLEKAAQKEMNKQMEKAKREMGL